jgi:hypothetical protein
MKQPNCDCTNCKAAKAIGKVAAPKLAKGQKLSPAAATRIRQKMETIVGQ